MFNDIVKTNIWKDPSSQFIDNLKKNLFSYEFEPKYKRQICLDLTINISEVEEHAYYGSEKNSDDATIEYSISFRIGENKRYVVKSIASLLEAIIQKDQLYLGTDFTFDSNRHMFNEIDKKIINFLMDMYVVKDNVRGVYSPKFSSKEVYLNEIQFSKLLKIIKDRKFSGLILSEHLDNIYVKEESLPIGFMVQKDKLGISIKLIGNRIYTIGKNLFYCQGNIYIPPKNEGAIYLEFCKMLTSNRDKMIIGEKAYGVLGSYIIPAMKSISNNVIMDSSVRMFLKNYELASKLYIDNIDNEIYCKVIFQYGEILINPLLDRDTPYINQSVLVRDINNESKIINTLNQYKFSPVEDSYRLSSGRQEDILEFISDGIKDLQEKCEIYCTDAFKSVKVYSPSTIQASISINREDLLEFSFELEDINKDELYDIYKSLKLKKRYHKLKDGGFVIFNSSVFEEFMDTVTYMGITSKDVSKDTMELPKYNAMYLNERLESRLDVSIQKDEGFKKLISSMKDINESSFDIPKSLEPILREYQKTGFKWFCTLAQYGFGGILADEMGLGKTLQAISFMKYLKDKGQKLPMLVVCPTSLIYNWDNEIKKFSKDIKALIIVGNKTARREIVEIMEDYDVVITSYPLLRADSDLYKDKRFLCTFIDEAQNIKNGNSLTATSVKLINTKYKFALTGTPIENNLSELWSIFDFIMPGYLLTNSKFKKLYEIPVIKDSDENALSELNKRINPFILRRYKKDVIHELPEKIQHKLLIDLNDKQRTLYSSYVKMYKEEINEQILSKGIHKSKIKILSLLTRLRQICCDPASFIEDYTGGSAKIEALLEIVNDNLGEKHRILIFSQFTTILKSIKSKFNDEGINSFYLDGATPSENRMEMVNAFNEGENDVFLISLKAGGTGLNLTGADTVIHFDPWWNPAAEDQATDRAHRIGQNKTVEVIKMITKGTIEEKISLLQEKKKDIFDSVVNNVSRENILAVMDEKAIMDLFMED